jgi:hypothetical protein
MMARWMKDDGGQGCSKDAMKMLLLQGDDSI